MTKVAGICSVEKPEEKWKRVYLLSNMERDQIYNVFEHTKISSVSYILSLHQSESVFNRKFFVC